MKLPQVPLITKLEELEKLSKEFGAPEFLSDDQAADMIGLIAEEGHHIMTRQLELCQSEMPSNDDHMLMLLGGAEALRRLLKTICERVKP